MCSPVCWVKVTWPHIYSCWQFATLELISCCAVDVILIWRRCLYWRFIKVSCVSSRHLTFYLTFYTIDIKLGDVQKRWYSGKKNELNIVILPLSFLMMKSLVCCWFITAGYTVCECPMKKNQQEWATIPSLLHLMLSSFTFFTEPHSRVSISKESKLDISKKSRKCESCAEQTLWCRSFINWMLVSALLWLCWCLVV